MKVKFKNGQLQYTVLEEGVEYDEVLGKYCPCYLLAGMGWHAQEMCEPAEGTEIEATDVMISIWK
jgi:hypothetical protein